MAASWNPGLVRFTSLQEFRAQERFVQQGAVRIEGLAPPAFQEVTFRLEIAGLVHFHIAQMGEMNAPSAAEFAHQRLDIVFRTRAQ